MWQMTRVQLTLLSSMVVLMLLVNYWHYQWQIVVVQPTKDVRIEMEIPVNSVLVSVAYGSALNAL